MLQELPSVQTGLALYDLTDERWLEAQTPDTAFIPASTMKLVTTATVLTERGGLGGWWSTELTRKAGEQGAKASFLTLQGGGDPTLSVSGTENSLRALAKQAYARGIREVGEVRLPAGFFVEDLWPSNLSYRTLVPLQLAEWYEQPPATVASARANLTGHLIEELRRAGIAVINTEPQPATAAEPYTPPPRQDEEGNPLPPVLLIPPERRPEVGVASVRSEGVFQLLAQILRPSDNELAESLRSTLGPDELQTAERQRELLTQLGIPLGNVVLADGSGLSRENRLTPRTLVTLLKVMYDLPYPLGATPATPPNRLYAQRQSVFAEALPQAGTGEEVAGHDGRGGTLAQRMQGQGLDVRAKTGTLPGVSSLAGYVTGKKSGHTLAFAIMMNGPDSSPILTLRAKQDELVAYWAEQY